MNSMEPLSVIQNSMDDCRNDFRSPSKPAIESHVMYKDLLAKGKSAAAAGNLNESLEAYQKAYKMKPTEKILQRIKKIEEVIKEVGDEEGNDDFIQLDNGLIIYRQLVERLYPHQIEGVKWIYDLQRKRKKGGILADDMGLGKTIQVISALSAMFDMELIQNVLLVLPLSLIPNWQREFEKWAPGIKLKSFYGSAKERSKALDYAQRRPAVCITTYGLVVTQWVQLGQTKYREEFVWDYIILDEGHKIKNPSKTTKGLHAIPSKNRLILTGTPIQNNLRELWALFDWVTQGTLLGTKKTFKMEYETPITKARQRGASSGEIHLGNYMAESLRKIVDPFILRRTKGSVSAPKPGSEKVDESQSTVGRNGRPSFPKLKKKNDFVIWTYLSELQEEIYRDFLAQDSIKELLASKRSPLVYLTILKKICDHPRLLPRRACSQLGLEANDSLHEDDFHTEKGKECAANRIDNISDETLIQESGKLQFLLELLKRLRDEGHRTLIFSLSRKMLNIIHRILMNNRFKVMRLDGTISKLSDRELRVKKFQQDSTYDVFLLTTQVGGVGLTLTAADRVVIFDPSWNPATDAQAVDRIYRIGQEKNVVVYRLITCGTVEEKIYRRQIFKDSIIKQSTGDNKDPYRYFTNHELKELFQLENTHDSMTQRQLQDLHIDQRCLGPKLDEHLAYLHTLYMFGVSDHDLMFSQDPDDIEGEVMDEHKNAIQNKVAEARSRVELEAKTFSGNSETEQRWGDFDIRTKVSEPKLKEDEPKFEIDGLYDKLDSLKVEDDAVENIFNQSKISMKSEPVGPITEPTIAIDMPDSADESQTSMPTLVNGRSSSNDRDEAILVEDSPEKALTNNSDDIGTLEIGESFVSSFGTPSRPEGRKSKSMTRSEGLLESDISCIPIQSSRNYVDANKHVSPKRDSKDMDMTNETPEDHFFDYSSATDFTGEGDGNDRDEIMVNGDPLVVSRVEDFPKDQDDSEPIRAGSNSPNDLVWSRLQDSPKCLDRLQDFGDSEQEEAKDSLKHQRDVGLDDSDNPVDDDSEFEDDTDHPMQTERFSLSNGDSGARSDPTVAPPPRKVGKSSEEDNDSVSDNLNLEDSVNEKSDDESGSESPRGFFVEQDTPLARKRHKKKHGRLISDSDSNTDEKDSDSLKGFIVEDDEGISHSNIYTESSRQSVGSDRQKVRRRSTAVCLPRFDSDDESSEEKDTSTNYRDTTNASSEAENSRLSGLQLSFESEDEDFC